MITIKFIWRPLALALWFISLTVSATNLTSELESFEQCWLTGTAAEVTPVGQIDTFRFEVGQLARQMSSEYEKEVRS